MIIYLSTMWYNPERNIYTRKKFSWSADWVLLKWEYTSIDNVKSRIISFGRNNWMVILCQTIPLNRIRSQYPLGDCQTTRCRCSWFNSRRTCSFVWLILFCVWSFSAFSVDICWLGGVMNFVNNSFERMSHLNVFLFALKYMYSKFV